MSDGAQRSWVRGFGDFFAVAALTSVGQSRAAIFRVDGAATSTGLDTAQAFAALLRGHVTGAVVARGGRVDDEGSCDP